MGDVLTRTMRDMLLRRREIHIYLLIFDSKEKLKINTTGPFFFRPCPTAIQLDDFFVILLDPVFLILLQYVKCNIWK